MQFLYGRQIYFQEFVPLPLLQPLQKFRGLHAEGLNLSTIYTPQIVVNGTSECVGNNAGAVTSVRPLFEQTLALFDRETNPLADRRPAFGRKMPPPAQQPGFGRA